MCYALLQVYACSHERTVCNTPCPRAVATGLRIPKVDAAMTQELSRSSSVVSSMAPAAASRSDVQDLLSQRAGDAQNYPAPLRIVSRGAPGRQQDGASPGSRFVARGQEPLPPPPTYSPPGRTSSMSSQEPSTSYAKLSRTSSTMSQQSSSTLSAGGILVNPSSTSPMPAKSQVDDFDVEPNICAYHFPRYVSQSRYPCMACYSEPKWEVYRSKWMKMYRELHPNVKQEDIERLSGVAEAMKPSK